MRGFDAREWKALDWAAFASLIASVLIPTINAAVKDYPEFAARMPAFVSWPYLPVPLLLFLIGVIAIRSMERTTPRQSQRSLFPPRAFPKVRYEPEADFALLPQHFTVDLTAQFPHIEVSFFAVSFLPRPIKLTEVDLSLRLYGAATLEDITFRQKDWQVDPKDCDVVFCRRNLTDLERTKIPWQTGRVTGAFQLAAKATDGEKTFSYGPVSSKVIEGWINVLAKINDQPSSDLIPQRPLPFMGDDAVGPDWPIRELFYHVRPSLKHGSDVDFEATGLEVRDKLSTDRLKMWGRQKTLHGEIAPFAEIAPTYWQRADFTYFFLAGDEENKSMSHTRPDSNSSLAEYYELHVNRAQALKLWPKPFG